MSQFKDVPAPEDAVRWRMDLSPEDARTLRRIALEADITAAALCRITMHLLARGVLPVAIVLDEARRIKEATVAARKADQERKSSPPPPRRLRGQPRGAKKKAD